MDLLNKKEIEVAKKIISAGLVKSAESLSFFMNETITLKDFESDQLLNGSPWESSKKDESNIQLLTTKVIGDFVNKNFADKMENSSCFMAVQLLRKIQARF